MIKQFWAKVVLICGILLISIGFTHALEAHAGGTPRIVNEPAGDFVISVWSLPDPITPDVESNFVVFVADGEGFELSRAATPVLGAEIELVFAQGSDELTYAATHERAANKLFYESYLTLPSMGAWTVDVSVAFEGKQGEAQFVVDVAQGEAQINWLLYGGIGLVVIAVAWFVWQSFSEDDEDEGEELKTAV